MHATTPGRCRGPQGMVVAAGRRRRRSRLSEFKWGTPQRRCIPAARLKTYHRRASDLSVAEAKEGDAPHVEALSTLPDYVGYRHRSAYRINNVGPDHAKPSAIRPT